MEHNRPVRNSGKGRIEKQAHGPGASCIMLSWRTEAPKFQEKEGQDQTCIWGGGRVILSNVLGWIRTRKSPGEDWLEDSTGVLYKELELRWQWSGGRGPKNLVGDKEVSQDRLSP